MTLINPYLESEVRNPSLIPFQCTFTMLTPRAHNVSVSNNGGKYDRRWHLLVNFNVPKETGYAG